MAICPQGHPSTAEDYCDVCGAPIPSGAGAQNAGPVTGTEQPTGQPAAPATPARPATGAGGTVACPNCSAGNPQDALFCEACGYDFTTGSLPREAAGAGDNPGTAPSPAADATAGPPAHPSSPAQPAWVVEVWIDPDWYALQNSPDPMPSPGPPQVVALAKPSMLVGRTSRSRGIIPDIECAADTGISRRQAQLTSDGSRWFVEDLDSANGTFVAPAAGPLPRQPLPASQRTEVRADMRIYLGAWTRMVIRPAAEGEA